MKATGMVRKIDELGRVVIPVELRRNLNLEVKDPLEIFIEGEQIILSKYSPGCIFCGEVEGVTAHFDKFICPKCREAIRRGK